MIVWGQENIFIVLAVYLHLINKREYASAGKKFFTFVGGSELRLFFSLAFSKHN